MSLMKSDDIWMTSNVDRKNNTDNSRQSKNNCAAIRATTSMAKSSIKDGSERKDNIKIVAGVVAQSKPGSLSQTALNLLFTKTLEYMKISRSELSPSSAPFHGVIPRQSATPLGQITLPVTFGAKDNYHTENICFEVADFETAYRTIIGRPTLAKFMAVSHYTYLMIKIPGPHGVIVLRSDIKQAFTCKADRCKVAQSVEIQTSLNDDVPAKKAVKITIEDKKADST
uniref:Uncharacterized protein n=1 Tax=Oryza brachyantha TaxID=4533 RepID=J3LPS9_ORYBR